MAAGGPAHEFIDSRLGRDLAGAPLNQAIHDRMSANITETIIEKLYKKLVATAHSTKFKDQSIASSILFFRGELEWDTVRAQLTSVLTESFRTLLKSESECTLKIMSSMPKGFEPHKKNYILHDPAAAGEEPKLHYVNAEGVCESVPITDFPKFIRELNTIRGTSTRPTINLSGVQIDTLITLNGGHTREPIENRLSWMIESRSSELADLLVWEIMVPPAGIPKIFDLDRGSRSLPEMVTLVDQTRIIPAHLSSLILSVKKSLMKHQDKRLEHHATLHGAEKFADIGGAPAALRARQVLEDKGDIPAGEDLITKAVQHMLAETITKKVVPAVIASLALMLQGEAMNDSDGRPLEKAHLENTLTAVLIQSFITGLSRTESFHDESLYAMVHGPISDAFARAVVDALVDPANPDGRIFNVGFPSLFAQQKVILVNLSKITVEHFSPLIDLSKEDTITRAGETIAHMGRTYQDRIEAAIRDAGPHATEAEKEEIVRNIISPLDEKVAGFSGRRVAGVFVPMPPLPGGGAPLPATMPPESGGGGGGGGSGGGEPPPPG